jgi:hypothetical protein
LVAVKDKLTLLEPAVLVAVVQGKQQGVLQLLVKVLLEVQTLEVVQITVLALVVVAQAVLDNQIQLAQPAVELVVMV